MTKFYGVALPEETVRTLDCMLEVALVDDVFFEYPDERKAALEFLLKSQDYGEGSGDLREFLVENVEDELLEEVDYA